MSYRILDIDIWNSPYLYHYVVHDDSTLNCMPQYIFKFNNDYGASVISEHNGPWELAVIKFDPTDNGELNYDISYNTEITDDVINNLTDEDVNRLLDRISNLDENGEEYVEEDEPD